MNDNFEELIIVFHYKPDVDSSIAQDEELTKAKSIGMNITVLERQVMDSEEIPVPSLYLLVAYKDKEPEVLDHKQGVIPAEDIVNWIKEYESVGISR